jgi:hypothetical protein
MHQEIVRRIQQPEKRSQAKNNSLLQRRAVSSMLESKGEHEIRNYQQVDRAISAYYSFLNTPLLAEIDSNILQRGNLCSEHTSKTNTKAHPVTTAEHKQIAEEMETKTAQLKAEEEEEEEEEEDDHEKDADFVAKVSNEKEWYEKRSLDESTTKMMRARQSSFGGTLYVESKPADPGATRISSSGTKKTAYDREHDTDFLAIREEVREDVSKKLYDIDEAKEILALAEVSANNLTLISHATHKTFKTKRANTLKKVDKARGRFLVDKAIKRLKMNLTKGKYQKNKIKDYGDKNKYIFDTKLLVRRRRKLGDPKGVDKV